MSPTPEQLARQQIDTQLAACGWAIQDYKQFNPSARRGIALRKSFTYEEVTKRDKVNLDIFWLKDDALEESANLPAPEIIAADIAADLEAALEQFATIAVELGDARSSS